MSLSYHARTFIVESPLWDQVLHRQRVITRAQAVFLVKLMRFHDWSISSSTPSPGVAGTCTMPPLISNGCLVRRWLPSCQIQWVSMAVMLPGAAAATWVNIASEMSKWLLEWEPGQAELMAHLRHANRALHRPEVRVCQRNVHRLQRERVPHLTPVGRDHVGGGWQPGGATELRHYFTSGEPCSAPHGSSA